MAMMVGITASAQEKKTRPEPLNNEQRTELQVKRMTLALDLNENQQKDMQKLMLERNKKREQLKNDFKANKAESKKLTADERFSMQTKMLDEKIAMKDEMKKMLTAEQFAKWETIKKDRKGKITKKGKKFKKHDKG